MADLQLQLGLLKYEDVRTAIKNYFENVRGVNYSDGNNFSILIDALSYLQEMTSYQLSQQANNNFSRICTDRKSAVENAYKLGYVPNRKIPNQLELSAVIDVNNDLVFYGKRSGLPYTVYKNTKMAVQEDAKTIYIKSNGLSSQKFTLPTINVSNQNITIKVIADNVEVKYTNFDIYDQIPNSLSNIFYISESIGQEYFTEITFGNGILGSIPASDATIEIKYFECNGIEANDEIDLESLPSGVTVIKSLNVGQDHETLKSIQNNSGKYHSSRGRLVTNSDYINFFKSKKIKSVDVSETSGGINYYYAGNIYVSLVPDTFISEGLVDELNKTSGLTDLKLLNWKDESNSISYINQLDGESLSIGNQSIIDQKKIISTNTISSSPSYIYCDITPTIESDISGYRFTTNDLKLYRNKLMKYTEDTLFGFDSDFRTDSFSKYLFSNVDSSVKSVKYDIDYAIIFTQSNLLDTYVTVLPNNFIATNEDYYILDNNFLGRNYSLSDMPLDRHVLYAKLGDSIAKNGIIFNRYLYNGYKRVTTDNNSFIDAMTFDFDSLSNNLLNINSFPVYLEGRSNTISIQNMSIYLTSIFNNNRETIKIGNVDVISSGTYKIPYITLDINSNGSNIDWNTRVRYDIKKKDNSKYKIVLSLVGTNNSQNVYGNQYMTLSSESNIGKLFINESGSIDFKLNSNNIGGFLPKNKPDSIEFSLANSVKFKAIYIDGKFQISTSGVGDENFFINSTDLRLPIIKNDYIFIAEKTIDGTDIGQYNTETNTIYYNKLLSSSNNVELTDIITLKDFIGGTNNIITSDKYKLEIKPKYEVVNNKVLIYKQDFDRKSSLFKIININTLRNK